MPGDHEGQLYVFLCIYADRRGLLCILSNRTCKNILCQQRRNCNWKNRVSHHRIKFYPGSVLPDDTSIFPGDRKWKSKSFSVCHAPDLLPDSNFLGIVTSGTSLYLVRISNLRGPGSSCRINILSKNDYGMEEMIRLIRFSLCL